MLSTVLKKKSLRQNNSIWLNIRVGEAGVSILWRASVRLRREDGNPVGFKYRCRFVVLVPGSRLEFLSTRTTPEHPNEMIQWQQRKPACLH